MLKIVKRAIEWVLDYCLLKTKSFQDYVNYRFIPERFRKYDLVKGAHLASLVHVLMEYSYSDIKGAIVLDVGSNGGGFAIIAVEEGAKRVYAVEPLYADILRENIRRNNIKNVEVIEVGIGRAKERVVLRYGSRKKRVNIVTFSELLKNIGEQIDFLKIDCEGCEYCVKIVDLRGIKRIEAELHKKREESEAKYLLFLNMLDSAGFIHSVDYHSETSCIVHAFREEEE